MRKVHPCALSLSKLLGMPSLTLEGCDTCRGVVTSCSETEGGGATTFTASMLLIMVINLFKVSSMARVASACSLSLFSICWNLLSSMAVESTTFGNCYGGGIGGSGW
jgi:hypothetical protein